MTATFVNLSLWFSWWIQLYWLVLLVFKVGGLFDNACTYINQINTFYCDIGKTVGALTIIYLLVLSCLLGLMAYEAYTIFQTHRVECNYFLLGMVLVGFFGQFLWSCAILSLSNNVDAFAAVDLQLVLDVVLIHLVFTAYVGFMARAIFGGTQFTAQLAAWVSTACACLGWSLLILDGRRMTDSNVFYSFSQGGPPPCSGGVHCAETAVMFVALLLITLAPTFSVVYIATNMSRFQADGARSSARHDGLLNASDDTGAYQPVTTTTQASTYQPTPATYQPASSSGNYGKPPAPPGGRRF